MSDEKSGVSDGNEESGALQVVGSLADDVKTEAREGR
jgi:hypothetical protein